MSDANAASTTAKQDNTWITNKSADDILKDADGGYLYTTRDRAKGNDQQCTALVKHVTGLGPTSTWKEGDKIGEGNKPDIQPGTAIATFKNGQYESKSTGNHAAIFLGYGEEKGKSGMYVLDQWSGQPAHKRFILFDTNRDPQNNAGAYSVIAK
ncbi:MAG: BPSL0067 family protein [Alphaproteobacteria bacterium]|nr:BPSL0067 family protein [Alphaproteobacteria bacterium]